MNTIRLLTIGNSFSQNALRYLESIAKSAGRFRFLIGRASLGGCSLEKHWNLARYTAQHPEYKTYEIFTGRFANIQDALKARRWDIITLQQVSTKSWLKNSFQPFLDNLTKLVNDFAPSAKIMLHQTWAYRSDAPFFPQNGITQQKMFDAIKCNYDFFAKRMNCKILPVGEAVQKARTAPDFAFSWPEPDYKYQQAKAPSLPTQKNSLIAGWHWAIKETADGIPELRNDSIHLNSAGCYLAGCVWHQSLTGMDIRKIKFRPKDVDSRTASFLRQTAYDVCAG